jgi:Fibronectin type III domain
MYFLSFFVDLRKADTGVYTCRAVSETGETARGAALIVETPSNPTVIFHRTPEPSTFPGSPTKPSVSDVTENSVRLSWRPSATHGASAVTAYTVEYFSHETLEVSVDALKMNDVSSLSRCLNLRNIIPYYFYPYYYYFNVGTGYVLSYFTSLAVELSAFLTVFLLNLR